MPIFRATAVRRFEAAEAAKDFGERNGILPAIKKLIAKSSPALRRTVLLHRGGNFPYELELDSGGDDR